MFKIQPMLLETYLRNWHYCFFSTETSWMLWNTKQNVIELITQGELSEKPLQNSLTSAKQTAWRSHEYLRAKVVCKSLDFLATTSQLSCRNWVGRKLQSSWLKRGESKGAGLNGRIRASKWSHAQAMLQKL